jgi:hypothetical protein
MTFPKSGSVDEKDVAFMLVALTELKAEVSTLSTSKVLNKSTSLVTIIQRSSLCDHVTLQEASALKAAAQNVALVISEIQEKMAILETTLRSNAIISSTLSIAELSTSTDISAALEIAVNGPEKDWTSVAKIVERFWFLHEEIFDAMDNNNQMDNY